MIFVWLFFLSGAAVHVYAKARKVIGSQRNREVMSWRAYWRSRGGAIAVRSFFAAMLFGLWTLRPELVDQLAAAAAENLQPGMIRSVLEKITFPLNVFTGGIVGYVIDSGLEKIPWLSRELPVVNGDGNG